MKTDRQRQTETETETDRQTDRQIDRDIDRETERQRDRDRDREENGGGKEDGNQMKAGRKGSQTRSERYCIQSKVKH